MKMAASLFAIASPLSSTCSVNVPKYLLRSKFFFSKKRKMDVLDILWKWRVFWGKHTSGGFCFLSANIWGVGQKITRLHHGICPPSFRENTTHPQANYPPPLRTLDQGRGHEWVTFLLVALEMDLKDKDSEAQGSLESFWCCVSSEMALGKFRLIFLLFSNNLRARSKI